MPDRPEIALPATDIAPAGPGDPIYLTAYTDPLSVPTSPLDPNVVFSFAIFDDAAGDACDSDDDGDNERPKRVSIDCKRRATPTPSAIAASSMDDISDTTTSRASLGCAVAQSSQRAPGRTVGIGIDRCALARRPPRHPHPF